MGGQTLGLNLTGEGGVGRLDCGRVGPERGCKDPMGQFVCLGVGGTTEALVGFKLKKGLTGIPVCYGPWCCHLATVGRGF